MARFVEHRASFTTLRTSTLAFVYSVIDPERLHLHAATSPTSTLKDDVVLNDDMSLISGALTATPVNNLSVLSDIPPAKLRRDLRTLKLAQKRDQDDSLVPSPTVLVDQQILENTPGKHFASQTADLPLELPPSSHSSWIADTGIRNGILHPPT